MKKRTFFKFANPEQINNLFLDLKENKMPYLSDIKWHPSDFKVKITIEKIRETKK